jgi:hypothetical protein
MDGKADIDMRSLEGFSDVASQHSTRGEKAQETKMQAGKRATGTSDSGANSVSRH